MRKCLINAYLDLIKAGLPFEIIDGNNFYLPHRFLTEIFMNSNENGQRKILVISILGPKQTGKSTLLQYLFGIQITKRSTKGLYGSLIKSNIEAFNYILVLDIDGFDENDDEYDRRMTLFCMSVSHIVILNVSNDIPNRFMDLLSICNNSLKHLMNNQQNFIFHLVINQLSSFNINNQKLISNKTSKYYQEKLISNSNIHIRQEAIHFLPIAFRKDISSTRIYTETIFSESTQDLCMKIIHSFLRFRSITLSEWLNTGILVFNFLQEKPSLSYFQNLIEYLNDDSIIDYIRHCLSEYLTPIYRQKLMESILDKSFIEIDQIFNIKILESQDYLRNQLNNRLNIIKASESIRERSKHFLQRQIYEIIDGWRLEAIAEVSCRQFNFEEKRNSPKNKSNRKRT